MDTMAPIRPAVRLARSILLAAEPSAAARARREVKAAICSWEIPVDPAIAALLTSELVTNAITHPEGGSIVLRVACADESLRVDVHDKSRRIPVPKLAVTDAEAGRGLMLVAELATDWGFYPTPSGKAVYFTLAFQDDIVDGGGAGRRGSRLAH